MSKNIWYIHGAYSTSRTFNWIKAQLPEHQAINFDYSSYTPVNTVLEQLQDAAAKEDEPFDIVGHSLGGIFATILSQTSTKVRRVVTLSTPFGGSRMAAWLQFMAPGSLLEDIQPFSTTLRDIRNYTGPGCPMLSVVTTGGGSPVMLERNDGVVTVRSQRALKGPKYIERELNHFEVLLDPTTATAITEFLW